MKRKDLTVSHNSPQSQHRITKMFSAAA